MPLTVSSEDPGPIIFISDEIAGSADSRLIVFALEKKVVLKLIISALVFAFASSIACRNEPAPALFALVTTNVAPLVTENIKLKITLNVNPNKLLEYTLASLFGKAKLFDKLKLHCNKLLLETLIS